MPINRKFKLEDDIIKHMIKESLAESGDRPTTPFTFNAKEDSTTRISKREAERIKNLEAARKRAYHRPMPIPAIETTETAQSVKERAYIKKLVKVSNSSEPAPIYKPVPILDPFKEWKKSKHPYACPLCGDYFKRIKINGEYMMEKCKGCGQERNHAIAAPAYTDTEILAKDKKYAKARKYADQQRAARVKAAAEKAAKKYEKVKATIDNAKALVITLTQETQES